MERKKRSLWVLQGPSWWVNLGKSISEKARILSCSCSAVEGICQQWFKERENKKRDRIRYPRLNDAWGRLPVWSEPTWGLPWNKLKSILMILSSHNHAAYYDDRPIRVPITTATTIRGVYNGYANIGTGPWNKLTYFEESCRRDGTRINGGQNQYMKCDFFLMFCWRNLNPIIHVVFSGWKWPLSS